MVRKFLRLTGSEQWLFVKAMLAICAVRSGLTFLSFTKMRKITADLVRRTGRRPGKGMPVEQIVWSIDVASRYVPNATCLTRALAAQILLVRHGYSAHLRIGVAKQQGGAFMAHAWIEHEGKTVIGELKGETFTPLPALEEKWVS